jgi:hypothetical protein
MFNEKDYEYSKKQKTEIPVWISPKYEESRAKALEIIKMYDDITEADFWILMNETSTGKMGYTGLIISHNGCLKINEHLDDDKKFKPECVIRDKDGYNGSLVYEYCCPEQGLYEVGEVSRDNCKNAYPYAMAFKRLYDRVVLKTSKLAFGGIYSESESDEFRRQENGTETKLSRSKYDVNKEMQASAGKKISKGHISVLTTVANEVGADINGIMEFCKVEKLEDMTEEDYGKVLAILNERKGA